jgi:uncharacterized protein (TIGR04255 family)
LLPVPPIPIDIVKMEPNMQGVPSFSLDWDKFIILGNPYYVAISAKLPYTSWKDFKEGIEYIYNIIFDSNLFNTITRYSIKYVDFIDISTCTNVMDILNINLNISDIHIKNEKLILQIELQKEMYLHIIKIATSATLVKQVAINIPKNGLLIETDTLNILKDPISPNEFLRNHITCLDDIHVKNKEMFFDILSNNAISLFEPIYNE